DLVAGGVEAVEAAGDRLKEQFATLDEIPVLHVHLEDAAAALDGHHLGRRHRSPADAGGLGVVAAAVDAHRFGDVELAAGDFHVIFAGLFAHAGDHAGAAVAAVGGALQIHRLADVDELILAAVVGLFRGGGDGVLVGRLDEEYAAVALGDALGGVALAAKDAGNLALHVGIDARGLDGGQHLTGLHAVADADVDFVHHPAEGSEYELGVAAG